MDPKLALLLARLTSTLGSVLTAASVPLYLAEKGQAHWIPQTLIAMAGARIMATFGLLPRLSRFADVQILPATAATGALALAFFATGHFYFGALGGSTFFVALVAVATLLGSIDDAVAHSSLATLASGATGATSESGQRWVHLDSTLFTLSRLSAPAVAGMLLAVSGARLEVILSVDALSYGLALALYCRFLPRGSVGGSSLPSDPRANPLWGVRSVVREFRERGDRWWPLLTLGFGASAYNAGVVIYLKGLGYSLAELSGFMTAQNAGMVLTGLLLTRSPAWARYRAQGTLLASLGLFLISFAHPWVPLWLASALMAVGMVIHLQGLRAELASGRAGEVVGSSPDSRRFALSLLTLLNSSTGIGGALIWSGVAPVFGWRACLQAGSAGIFLAGMLCLRGSLRATAEVR